MGSAERTVPPDAEVHVLAAVAGGDLQAALAQLMDLYGGSLYRYACRVMGDPDLAKDVLQTTFLQAYKDLLRFGGRSSLKVWLYGIARHRCLDALKARRRWFLRFLPLPDSDDFVAPDLPPGSREDAELKDVLARCLQALKPVVRTAVMLRFHDGFSYSEMAGICAEQPATLQARVARALPVLKRCLERHGMSP
jgi:RNA polymerase sigma factor (sigma-70 family)